MHELDPSDNASKALPGDATTMDRRTTVGSAPSPVHPKSFRLFPDQDPIWKTSPSDKEANGGPPTDR